MKRIRNSSVLVPALAVAALVGCADTAAAAVDLAAPRNFLLAGRRMAVSARVTNEAGALLSNRPLQWQSSDPARATVDNAGNVDGRLPGIVNITAADPDSGAASLTLYIYPGRIAVTPPSSPISVGDSVPLTAAAFDAQGSPLPGVPFKWFSGLPAVATVDASGTLMAVAEGRVTITAAIDGLPELEGFTGALPIEIRRRPDFRLKRLISSDVAATGTKLLIPTSVTAAGNNVAAITSLSNGAQALVLSTGGKPRIIASAGLPLTEGDRPVAQFQNVSVNARGDVLAQLLLPAEWCERSLVLFPAAANWAPTVLLQTTRCNIDIGSTSLDAQGGFIYREQDTIWSAKADGTRSAVVSVGDPVAGGGVLSSINNWSRSPFGTLVIASTDNRGVNTYFAASGGQVKKLFAVGDFVAGKTSQWADMPVEANAGEYLVHIGGSNWSSISRLAGGSWTVLNGSGQDDLGGIYGGFDASAGVYTFFADSKGVTSLFRVTGTTREVLATYTSWRDINQTFALGPDNVLALGTFGGSNLQLTRFSGGASKPIFAVGLDVDGQAGSGLNNISVPRGVSASAPILRTAGSTLLRGGASGFDVLLKPGDALPGGGNLAAIISLASNRGGDLAFGAWMGQPWGLYTYRGGTFRKVAKAEETVGSFGATLNWLNWDDGQIAINNKGQVAAGIWTNNGYAIFLFSDTAPATSAATVMRANTPAPGGGTLSGNRTSVAVDDNGRVLFTSQLSTGKTGLFLWSNGTVDKISEQGQNDPLGQPINDFGSLWAAGGKFYFRAYISIGNETLSYDGTRVQQVLGTPYAAGFGLTASNMFGPQFSVNSRGDLVYPVYTAEGIALFMSRGDGKDALTAVGSRPGPEGEWFMGFYGVAISEQGDVLFPALTWTGGRQRLSVYSATPQ